MSEVPGRKRPLRAVRRLDHDAVDVRLDASLLEYGRVSREAGLSSEEAVGRLRKLLDHGGDPPTPRAALVPRPTRRSLAVVAGGLAILAVAVIGLSMAQPASDDPIPVQPVAVGVGGFSEMFVATYLGQAGEGTESVLDPFLTGPVRLSGLSPGRLYVQNVSAVDVRQTPTGWSVVVAAQVLRRIEGGYGDPAIQHYRVEVQDATPFRSSAAPTRIASP